MKVVSFIPAKNPEGLIGGNRKEKSFYESYEVVSFDKKTNIFFNPVSLRFYGRGSTKYACLWVNGGNIKIHGSVHATGSGKCSTFNLHKPSVAAERAFKSAGFGFNTPIGGRGDSAVISALQAIATFLGLKHFDIINAHA